MLASTIRYPNLSTQQRDALETFLQRTFLPTLRQKWHGVSRNAGDFWRNNAKWLARTFPHAVVPHAAAAAPAESTQDEYRRGRPLTPFSQCSERTKRRKVKETRAEINDELLRRAASVPRVPLECALEYFLENSFTKAQYESIRHFTKTWHADIFPTYNEVREAKYKCKPEHIEVSEKHCVVPLEALLVHTTRRLLESKSDEELDTMKSELTLVAKWGCDGSSGHSTYSQPFPSPDMSDAALFLTSLVPCKSKVKRTELKSFGEILCHPRLGSVALLDSNS